MTATPPSTGAHTLADPDLVEAAVALAEQWIDAADSGQTDAERAASARLSAVVADATGLDLAVHLVDRVARPADPAVAARELARLDDGAAAAHLTPADRLLLGTGIAVAPAAPRLAVPLARRLVRRLFGHLLVDASDPSLAEHLALATAEGLTLDLVPLGASVLGDDEAAARADGIRRLLGRDDVDAVSVTVSSLAPQISTWDTEGSVARVAERLRPLYRAARDRRPPALVTLGMEEYRDLDLTLEVFTELLSEPEFHYLTAGIVLQAYLPDSSAALDRLLAFATARVGAGGAPIRVRLVKGANLSMEHVEAEVRGWAPAPYPDKEHVDAHFLAMAERMLRPENAAALRVGLGSHNLYDVALLLILAERRGVADMLDVEMLQGIAPAQARAVRERAGRVLLHTPVVDPEHVDLAAAYLVRRLEESARPQDFVHALATAAGGGAVRPRAGGARADHGGGAPSAAGGAGALAADLAGQAGRWLRGALSTARDRVPQDGRQDGRAESAAHVDEAATPGAASGAGGEGADTTVPGSEPIHAERYSTTGPDLDATPPGTAHEPARTVLPDQELRFRASVAAAADVPTASRRGAPGAREAARRGHVAGSPLPAPRPGNPSATEPWHAAAVDSDPALADVRTWAADAVGAPLPEPASPVLATTDDVDDAVDRGRAAGEQWAGWSPQRRAEVLRRAADLVEERRGVLVGAAAAEGGTSVAEADPEVSEAADLARYYALAALDLEPGRHHLATDGAAFTPATLTLVTPPWSSPVAIPFGGAAAALAAGSAVLVKPAPPVPVCAEIVCGALADALREAGAPADVLQVVRAEEDVTGPQLVAHAGVDIVVLTGARETARAFQTWRATRPGGPGVLAGTSGKNALVVTPSADVDLAVADLVASAFGHAGQKCSAASLAILVGSVGRGGRFVDQLVDAVRSLRVGRPTDLGATVGPLIAPPDGDLLRALTSLEEGETWLVEPRRLDETGRLWSPGLKDGVRPGSFFHRTEVFGPVLGLMRARTLDEALAWQNGTDVGLTGGLHSLDEAEIATWLVRVEVGNAYVNRTTTGAIVGRQPFGGWKASTVGPGAKTGGPDYVAQFGTWTADGNPTLLDEPADPVRAALSDYTGVVHDQADRSWLRAAVGSDARAWAHELVREIETVGLRSELNTYRQCPLPHLWLRAGAGTRPVELVRVLLAAELTGTRVRISLASDLSETLKGMDALGEPARAGLRRLTPLVERVEDASSFAARIRSGTVSGRVRVLGTEADSLSGVVAGKEVEVLTQPVLATGRRELLTVLRPQCVSRTVHRYGYLPAGGPGWRAQEAR